MSHVRQLGKTIAISIQPDENGFIGRECPQRDCEGYFKVQGGTGLKGEGLPCHCPYCGHSAGHDQFWTKEQVEYATSIAVRKVTDAFVKDLKQLEFDHRPSSMKVIPGRPTPIHQYKEKQLETEVVCLHCTLHYSVYGVFAYCPDCGEHNSLQILDKNLEVVEKMLDLASEVERDLAERLIENALEDCVSAFDGFGREVCRIHTNRSRNPSRVDKVSFQNLEGARANLQDLFAVDLSDGLTTNEWRALAIGFQKRHVVAHRMGVVDENYLKKTGEHHSIVGRKISIEAEEVREFVRAISRLASAVSESFRNLRKQPDKAESAE